MFQPRLKISNDELVALKDEAKKGNAWGETGYGQRYVDWRVGLREKRPYAIALWRSWREDQTDEEIERIIRDLNLLPKLGQVLKYSFF